MSPNAFDKHLFAGKRCECAEVQYVHRHTPSGCMRWEPPTPEERNPVVPVTDKGAEATCPYCATVCKMPWGADGRAEWWADPAKGHCVHFRGCYSTGDFRTVQARFL